MKYIHNDGGRAASGRRGTCGDCVTRALAIAMERPYDEIYNHMCHVNARTPKTRCRRKHDKSHSASSGIYTTSQVFKNWMRAQGWEFIATMGIGTGCKVHLGSNELPMGRIIARVSRHYTAVVDGVTNDIYDPNRAGTRCVYGYWRKAQ